MAASLIQDLGLEMVKRNIKNIKITKTSLALLLNHMIREACTKKERADFLINHHQKLCKTIVIMEVEEITGVLLDSVKAT